MSLNDPQKIAHILRQRAHYYSQRAEKDNGEALEMITFSRADAEYAIAINQFQEVRPLPGFCAIPGASRTVPGVFPYRGEILSVHDLAAFMDKDSDPHAVSWVLIVEHESKKMGLLADEVFGVVELSAQSLQAVPLTLHQHGFIFKGLIPKNTLLIDISEAFKNPRFAKSI